MNKTFATLAIVSLFVASGCSDTSEYTVAGQVSASDTVSGPITVEIFELIDQERTSLKKLTLEQVGEFSDTIEASSDASIAVVALVDSDEDGACSEGEMWAEQIVEPTEDGELPALELALEANACPASQ